MDKRITVILILLFLGFGGNVLPGLAHGEAALTVSPPVAAAGETITASLDGVESGETFTVKLIGLNIEETLGTMLVADGEDAVDQDFALPADLPPDVYQVEAITEEGETLVAELTVEASSIDSGSTTAAVPSAEPMQLDRSKPPAELAVIGGGIVISIGLGLWLVLAGGRRPTP
ncbi:MAG: hypothetical protein K8L99_02890 [Anaerolineae bacterium]|nr:hypothetical protein [Anaerolineae bacterium]